MEKEIMRTGFIDLDKIINLYEPKLIFLAGRPGMGKTTFAINVLANIGLKQNISVLMLHLEESKELIIDRIISKETQVDISKIKSKELNDLEFWVTLIKPQFEAERGDVSKGGIIRDDTLREKILNNAISRIVEIGFKEVSRTVSPIKGTKGNIEYLAHFII